MGENTETGFFETVTKSRADNENILPFRLRISADTFDARSFFSLNSVFFTIWKNPHGTATTTAE